MPPMVIRNQTKNTVLVNQGKLADTFLSRLKGLLGSPPLEKGQGLLLKHEKSVHTLFITFPIDVIYIDKDLQVIKVDGNMPPYKLGSYVAKSVYILELPVGVVQETHTAIGDQLSFSRDEAPNLGVAQILG